MMETQEFALLPLAWWQNPWFWGAVVACMLVFLIIVGICLYFWRKKKHAPRTPKEQFLHILHTMKAMPFNTLKEQQRACRIFTAAGKQYAQSLWHLDTQKLSDEEFVRALQIPEVDMQFMRCMQELCALAERIKFAGEPQAHEPFLKLISCCIDALCKE